MTSMIIYSRSVNKKLLSLRLILVGFVALLPLIFLRYGPDNLFYFISTAFTFGSLIVVKDFRVDNTTVEIVKYFLYGTVPIRWTFDKGHEIIIKSDGSVYGKDLDIADTDYSNTGLGTLFGCLFSIIANPKIGSIIHSLQKMKKDGKLTIKVYIRLTKQEFQILERFYDQKHGI